MRLLAALIIRSASYCVASPEPSVDLWLTRSFAFGGELLARLRESRRKCSGTRASLAWARLGSASAESDAANS